MEHYFRNGVEMGMCSKMDAVWAQSCTIFIPPRVWDKKLLKQYRLVEESVVWK